MENPYSTNLSKMIMVDRVKGLLKIHVYGSHSSALSIAMFEKLQENKDLKEIIKKIKNLVNSRNFVLKMRKLGHCAYSL